MTLFKLLVFPLLSGFLFLTIFKYTRFTVSRLAPQVLIFWSVLVGLFILLSVNLIANFSKTYLAQDWYQDLKQLIGFISAKSIDNRDLMTLLLGPVVAVIANFFIKDEAARRYNYKKYGSNLELLFYENADQVMMVSLEDNKIYIGYIVEFGLNPTLDENSFIVILPIASGYRMETQRRVVITTDYEKIRNFHEKQINPEDFKKYIPAKRIISASIFNADIYRLFQD